MMRVFQVDEENWYAAETPEEAVAAYLADVGEEAREYCDEFGPPEEVSGDALDKMIVDVDEPGQPKHSFRELLAAIKGTEARPFCTTCY